MIFGLACQTTSYLAVTIATEEIVETALYSHLLITVHTYKQAFEINPEVSGITTFHVDGY